MGKLTIMIRDILDDQPALRHRPPAALAAVVCGCSIPTGPCSSAGPSSPRWRSRPSAAWRCCGSRMRDLQRARARQPPQADPDLDVILGLALTIRVSSSSGIVPENLAVLGL